MRPIARLTLAAAALLGIAGLTVRATEPTHPHHHIHHALWELRDARKELKESKHDFGGHKQAALSAINDAIKNLDLALKNAGDDVKGAPARGDLKEAYKKYKHHPHLHHALHELKHAHHQLKEAKHNFGGHREAAMRDILIAEKQIKILLENYK